MYFATLALLYHPPRQPHPAGWLETALFTAMAVNCSAPLVCFVDALDMRGWLETPFARCLAENKTSGIPAARKIGVLRPIDNRRQVALEVKGMPRVTALRGGQAV